MLIRCAKCGKIVDAADQVAPEWSVSCPYCGENIDLETAEKFELPVAKQRTEPKTEKAEPAAAKPEPAKAKPEPVKEPEPAKKPEPIKEPESAKKPEPSNAPEPVKDAKPAKDPEPAKAPEAIKTPEPVKEPEPTKAPEPAKAPEAVKEAVPVKVPEPDKKPQPAKAPDPAKETKQVKTPEPAKEPEPVKTQEPVKKPESDKKPEPAKETKPVKAPEPAKKSAPAKGPEPVKVPEAKSEPPKAVGQPKEKIPEQKPEPKAPGSTAKTKIGIRRPSAVTVKNETEFVKEVVSNIESRVEKRDRLVHQKFLWRLFMWILTVLILSAIGGGGYVCWKKFEAEQLSMQDRPLKKAKPRRVIKKEKKKAPTPEEIAEKERQAKAAAARLEAERLEKERKRAAEELARKIAREFELVEKSFDGVRLAWWHDMPRESRPGASDGVCNLMVRSGAGSIEYYKIATSNKIATAKRVTKTALPADVPVTNCLHAALDHGGFFSLDGVVYFAPPSGGKSEWPVPAKGGAKFVPSAECFGALGAVVGNRKMDAKSLAFEVRINVGRDALTQKVGTLRYGEGLTYDDFAKAVRLLVKDVQKRGQTQHRKPKSFRKTVVFYEGTMIAKGGNGVTKVPYNPPADSGKEYYRWVGLRDEAQRQEREAARIEAENKANAPDLIYLIVGPPTDAEVDRLLRSTTVSFDRR